MKAAKTGKFWLDYHRIHYKKIHCQRRQMTSRIGNYSGKPPSLYLRQARQSLHLIDINDLFVGNILDFMNQLTEGLKPQTKCARFNSQLAFFNFAKNNIDPDFINLRL